MTIRHFIDTAVSLPCSKSEKDRSFYPGECTQKVDTDLLEAAERLYEWYDQWLTEYPENFQNLALIINLSKLSLCGGHYLPEVETRRAAAHLEQLREDLYLGKIGHAQFHLELNNTIRSLSESNPKTRLAALLAKLELRLHNHPLYGKSEWMENYQKMLQRIFSQVNSRLPGIYAVAVTQELTKIYANIEKQNGRIEEILPSLEQTIQGWL